jgi:acyl carrier protein
MRGGGGGAEEIEEIEEIEERMGERLPWYMRAEVVKMEALPLTVNGKVDRRRLSEESRDVRRRMKRSEVKPRSEMEWVLAGIWSEVLGVEEIGIEDEFFALGGHSLQAMQVASRVRRAFEIELPLEKIFTGPTIAQMATVVVQAQAQQTDSDEVARILTELEGLPSN